MNFINLVVRENSSTNSNINKAIGIDINNNQIIWISSLMADFIDIGFNLVKVYI